MAKDKNKDREKGKGSLPPKSDHNIALAEAIEMAKRYQRYSAPSAEKGGFFWADPVRKLLGKPNVVGLRYYHGLDEEGGYHIILLGVDKQGRDIVRQVVGGSTPAAKTKQKAASSTSLAIEGEDDPLENHWPCPPFCPTDSPFA